MGRLRKKLTNYHSRCQKHEINGFANKITFWNVLSLWLSGKGNTLHSKKQGQHTGWSWTQVEINRHLTKFTIDMADTEAPKIKTIHWIWYRIFYPPAEHQKLTWMHESRERVISAAPGQHWRQAISAYW